MKIYNFKTARKMYILGGRSLSCVVKEKFKVLSGMLIGRS